MLSDLLLKENGKLKSKLNARKIMNNKNNHSINYNVDEYRKSNFNENSMFVTAPSKGADIISLSS